MSLHYKSLSVRMGQILVDFLVRLVYDNFSGKRNFILGILSHDCSVKRIMTRMHCSRMRTVRCSSRLFGGGRCLPGGLSAQGEWCIPECTEADTPCGQNS